MTTNVNASATNTIILTVQGVRVTMSTHTKGDRELYRAQDLLREALGYTMRQAKDSIRNWKTSMVVKSTPIKNYSNDMHVKSGCNGGTYLTKNALFALCEHICPSFHESVLTSFSALTEGDLINAGRSANSVAIDTKLVDKTVELAKAINAAIPAWADGQGIPRVQAYPRIWGSIIAANMTGYHSVKKLKEELNVASVPALFREPEMEEHLGGLQFIMEQLVEVLQENLKWDTMLRIYGRKDVLEAREKRHAAREAKEAREIAAFEESQAEGIEW